MSEEVDPKLKAEFEAAVARVDKLPEQKTNIQLKLYGLYKQALFGDATGERPGRMKVRARAKFDEWASHKSMSKTEAMNKYIEFASELERASK